MDNIKTDFNYNEIECMLYLISFEYKRTNLQALKELLQDKYQEDLVNDLISYLLTGNILEKINEDEVYLYAKRLRDLIDEQIITNKFYDYLQYFHMCHW